MSGIICDMHEIFCFQQLGLVMVAITPYLSTNGKTGDEEVYSFLQFEPGERLCYMTTRQPWHGLTAESYSPATKMYTCTDEADNSRHLVPAICLDRAPQDGDLVIATYGPLSWWVSERGKLMRSALLGRIKNKYRVDELVKKFYQAYDFENPASWLKFAMLIEGKATADEYLNRQTNELHASPMKQVRVLKKSIEPIRKNMPLRALAVLKRAGQFKLEDYEAE